MRKLVVARSTVVRYHGSTLPVAQAILEAGFRSPENQYDWLGRGVYFWQYAPYRALEWAEMIGLQHGE